MKDFEKIKEKKKNDDFKGVLFIGLIFVIAVGIIVFIIIQLTNQYIELKEKLTKENKSYEETLTNPEESEKKIIISSNNKSVVDVKEIENRVKKTFSLKEELSNETKEKEIVADKNVKDDSIKNKFTKNQETLEKEKKEIKNKTEQPLKIVKSETKNISPKTNQKKERKINKTKESDKLAKKRYVVQLMAFKNQDVAKNELKKIQKILPDAFLMKIDLGSKGIWYRIRCCYTESYETAKKKVENIKKQLRVNPIIVKTDK
ncbi:SPOR domain-containing protein [Deferribacter autotrophicus]|uniref:SPOR domain-containing protein n=1 Tax=Deferribacter autotrophicus TaxID=500465 RepID=A0A5A8F6B2_9BACT|nr:SPOR domain-containing protein [Deferribacter autotrophicus]KAA0257413.1 SPOR domain-containing protein [Deferribacter autotrophicus]